MHGAFEMWVSEARGRRVSLLSVREISRGLLIQRGSKAVAIRARDRAGLLVRQDRWYVSIANNLDI